MISPVPGWGAPEICRRADSTSPHTEKPGACTAEKPAAGSGRHAIQGYISQKAERTGRPPVLSYYYALGRKPRKEVGS